MNRDERLNDQGEMLRVAMDGRIAGLWTAIPGIIQKFTAAKATCEVQPSIKGVLTDTTGKITQVNLPVLLDCPVVFPGGGGAVLTFPLEVGDECLVVFASRAIDAWWQSGGVQPPVELRMHDLSDGFVLPGGFSVPRVPASISTTKTTLRSTDNATRIEFDAAGQAVNIIAPGGTTFTGPVYANGKRIDQTHTHNGVTTGGGVSGVVT